MDLLLIIKLGPTTYTPFYYLWITNR